MTVYSLTTQRYGGAQANLVPYRNILRWLKDCSEREVYLRAMGKGDPEMKLLLGAEAPAIGMFDAGGVANDHSKGRLISL